MVKLSKEKPVIKGRTTKRLFDTQKLKVLDHAIRIGIEDQDYLDQLEQMATKEMFHGNKLWKLVNKYFNKDLKLNYITGVYSLNPLTDNLVTTRGKQIIAEQINGETTTPVTAIAIGTGTTAAAAGNTALVTEITTGGGGRGAATTSNQTTTTTLDTARWVKTFSFTSSFAVTEEGLLDNNTSGGNLLARQVFSAINVANGDSLQITHDVQIT